MPPKNPSKAEERDRTVLADEWAAAVADLDEASEALERARKREREAWDALERSRRLSAPRDEE